MEVIRKQAPAQVSIDAGGSRVEAIVSTVAVDRDGEIILPSAYTRRLDAYRRNPIHIWMHDPKPLENYLGRAVEVDVTPAGLRAVFDYAVDANPAAKQAVDLIRAGVLNCYSVGFAAFDWVSPREVNKLPAQDQAALQGIDLSQVSRIFTDVELREISLVGVPSNPEAFVIGRSAKESVIMKKPENAQKMDVAFNAVRARYVAQAEALAYMVCYDRDSDDMMETMQQLMAEHQSIGEAMSAAFKDELAEGGPDGDNPTMMAMEEEQEAAPAAEEEPMSEEKSTKSGRAISAANMEQIKAMHDHMNEALSYCKSLMSMVGQPEDDIPKPEPANEDDGEKAVDPFAMFLKSFR